MAVVAYFRIIPIPSLPSVTDRIAKCYFVDVVDDFGRLWYFVCFDHFDPQARPMDDHIIDLSESENSAGELGICLVWKF